MMSGGAHFYRIVFAGVFLLAGCNPLETDDGSVNPDVFLGNPTDDEAAYIFSTDEVRRYKVTVSPEDWDTMNTNLQSDDRRTGNTTFRQLSNSREWSTPASRFATKVAGDL